MSWVFLLLAIICEVCGTSFLKLTNGFSALLPLFGTFFSYLFSFYFLSLALKTISLGVAYAIWGGVGIVIITLIGYVCFHEPIPFLKMAFITCIVVGVVGLRLTEN